MPTITTTITTIMARSCDHDHHHHGNGLEALPRRGDAVGIALRPTSRSDPDKFFPWIQDLVAKDGPSILRCKGILSFRDDPERFVFQGVHMILDGDHQRPWRADEKRDSRIALHRAQSAGRQNPSGL